MSPDALTRYLHEHIPLTRAMEVQVTEIAADHVRLRAPLAPNINHRDTLFGGSASAIAILAAWSLLHTRLRAADIDCRLVIQRNTMDYLAPIDGAFTATATLEESDWPGFLRMLERRGKARIDVTAILEQDGAIGGRLTGSFVALRA